MAYSLSVHFSIFTRRHPRIFLKKSITDYEFYVQANHKKSLIRLARTGKIVGTVVNYLHQDDDVYAFSGKYLCSPSLVRHPDGFLLASMDLFNYNSPQNLIYPRTL